MNEGHGGGGGLAADLRCVGSAENPSCKLLSIHILYFRFIHCN